MMVRLKEFANSQSEGRLPRTMLSDVREDGQWLDIQYGCQNPRFKEFGLSVAAIPREFVRSGKHRAKERDAAQCPCGTGRRPGRQAPVGGEENALMAVVRVGESNLTVINRSIQNQEGG